MVSNQVSCPPTLSLIEKNIRKNACFQLIIKQVIAVLSGDFNARTGILSEKIEI